MKIYRLYTRTHSGLGEFTPDYIGCYDSYEEAENEIKKILKLENKTFNSSDNDVEYGRWKIITEDLK